MLQYSLCTKTTNSSQHFVRKELLVTLTSLFYLLYILFFYKDYPIQWVYHSSPGLVPDFGSPEERVCRVLLPTYCHPYSNSSHTPAHPAVWPFTSAEQPCVLHLCLLATCALSLIHHLHALSTVVLGSMCSQVGPAGTPEPWQMPYCRECISCPYSSSPVYKNYRFFPPYFHILLAVLPKLCL